MEAFPEAGWFERLGDVMVWDPELRATGRWFDLDFAIVADARTVLIEIRSGRLVRAIEDPGLEAAWSFTLRGGLEDWRRFLLPTPPPFYSDLLGMNRRVEAFAIEGDRKVFVRHLRPLHRLFELGRSLGTERGDAYGQHEPH